MGHLITEVSVVDVGYSSICRIPALCAAPTSDRVLTVRHLRSVTVTRASVVVANFVAVVVVGVIAVDRGCSARYVLAGM